MTNMRNQIEELVKRFAREANKFTSASYNYSETEARVEFIDPLFEILGWDMTNKLGIPNSLKEVIREESQQVESSTKRPDYTFRIFGQRKFFVEAKKPSIDITKHKESAFQARRYGWSAGLPISVLTNFNKLLIYDTRSVPDIKDSPDVALLVSIDFKELPKRLNELLKLLSRDAVAQGSIEAHLGQPLLATIQVNNVFLERINNWRLLFATDLNKRYPKLDLHELNDIVQKIINRIIFIRMCEDRGIESAERLRKAASKKDFIELRKLFKEMDERYDTGLFDAAIDPFQAKYVIDAQLFLDVVEELYFPKAPYSFSVLDADFLGQVYELFLTQRLTADAGALSLREKPAYENREIVTTPQPLVDELVRRTLEGLFNKKQEKSLIDYEQLKKTNILDIAVGSSRFLLRTFDGLVDEAIAYFLAKGDKVSVYERMKGEYRLSFDRKKELLLNCLYGIDIDYNAVEVARFSLLVKLLEEENGNTLPSGKRILPNLDKNIVWGNSVVDETFKHADSGVMELTRPLDWQDAFKNLTFDAIVCNPPYLKTEEMKSKTPDEFSFYKEKYRSPHKQFDKYFVFIEKAIEKLSEHGWIGMVVPNKWITIEAGAKLREIFAAKRLIEEIVDFGNELVFEGKSTYVCLLLLAKIESEKFYYRHVNAYEEWLKNPTEKGIQLCKKLISEFGSKAWILPGDFNEANVLSLLFSKYVPLGKVCEVFNGVQTSAEEIYAIQEWKEKTKGLIEFEKDGHKWEIEKAITKPYLIDSEERVHSYLRIEADCRLIFPYNINSNKEAILITPGEMQKRFPKTWAYLDANRARLLKRDIQPKPASLNSEFYRYGRHQSLVSAFLAPKIILSVNQVGDKYGFDLTGVGMASGGTAGEIAIANPSGGYSLEFFLGLFDQRIIEYFCRKRGSPFRGGYYSRGTAVLSDLPVPLINFKDKKEKRIHDDITADVRKIIIYLNKLKNAVGSKRESMEKEIRVTRNHMRITFRQLFGLKGEDIRLKLPGEN